MVLKLVLVAVFFYTPSLLYTSLLRADTVEVTIKTVASDNWTPQEIALVKKAAEIAFGEIATSDVANCAYRNSFRDDLSKDKLREKWGNQIPVLNKTKKVGITIHKEKLAEKVLGQARLGVAAIDKNMYQIKNLEISLSQEAINQHSKIYSNSSKSDDALNQWVNVIAHEVVHNFGYGHGTTGTWTENYPGYFVTEVGFCVMTHGKHGSDLGDPQLRRERQALSKKK